MGKGNSIPIPFLCLFFLSLSSTIPISAVDFPINVWPKPTNISWPTPQATTLSLNFTVTVTSSDNPFLYAAAVRYSNLFLFEKHHFLVEPNLNLTSSPPLQSLHVTVSDATIPLAHGVDESYTLTVPTDSTTANLTAKTAWGAIRGLETFSQLIYGDPPMVASGLYIEDQPLYLHRGVMLDTSRNYYGVDDLLRLIEAMSMNKLNVFHWHVTDSHSFPLELPSVAELAEKGAYGKDMLYSVDDVKKIVEFGMEHGVRVMPEIDMPGHTGSWAEAYPEIVTCANMFWAPTGSNAIAAEPGPGQLNPLNPRTYEVVENVIRDTLSMFPDSLYHSGADEINPNCWKTDPTIQDFLAKNGTLSQLLEKFINTTLPPILSQNRTVVYWEDVMLDATVNVTPSLLPKEKVILQTWNNGPNNTKRIVSAGYRAIVSSADYYYLDCGHGDFTGGNSIYDLPPGSNQGNGGSWCGPFKTWQIIYNYDITYGLTKDEAKLVIGGEVALWSEQADSTVMDPRIWPRSSAFGETMWSGNRDGSGKKRYGEANDRLIEWRYRMVKRGIGAEPIQPLWCIKNPGMCNTVSDN